MSSGDFAFFGMAVEEAAAPRTLAEAQDIAGQSQNRALFPWGGGTCQHVGYPPERSGMAVSTRHLNRITDYAPADMTVTAQAGVTIAQLQAELALHNQWLPLQIARPDAQTIGGIVATRAHSLTRFACGSVRDSLIGVTVINAAGEIIKGGGKVVKNVAGYDLPKLYCGSWGTLGLIADATFKVAPLPEASATVLLPLDADHNSEDALDALLGSELMPSFVCLLSPLAARDVLEADSTAQYIAIGFDGSAEAVAWQVETLGAGGGSLPDAIAETVRARLRDFSLRPAPMTCAFHILSSQVGAYSRMMEWTARRAGFAASVVSDAALGIVHAHVAPAADNPDWCAFHADLKDKAARVGGSFVVQHMPGELRAIDAPVWSPLLADFALMGRIKEALDPQRVWNPGRFAGRL